MSYEAWGDGDDGLDDYVTSERAEELFTGGAQVMREMLARFVEQGGDSVTAASIRANWVPSWGKDPGPWTDPIPQDCWSL
jgi:hypothetical protein